MRSKRAPLAVISAGALWGTGGFFVENIASYGLSSQQTVALKLSIAVVILLAYYLVRHPEYLKIRVRDIGYFIAIGFFSVTLFNVLFYYTILNSQSSIAVVLLYTSPIWIVLMSAIVFREKITVPKIIALILTGLGCCFVSGIFMQKMTIRPIVFLAGIGSGFFYGLYTVLGKLGLQKYNVFTINFYTFLIGLIGTIPLAHVGEMVELIRISPIVLLWGLGLSATNTAAFILYTWGLERMENGKAGILGAFEPIVGCIIGMTVLGESRTLSKFVGIVLVIAAVVLLNSRLSDRGN